MHSTNFLFNPSNIAVVGVSTEPTKLGSVVYNNLLRGGFKGTVYPVNPKYQEIDGTKCYASVEEIDAEIDLAIIVIPSTYVFDSVKDCVAKSVKFAIIISAGFRETGEEGAALEEEIIKYANENGMRIVGPNCLGIMSSESSMNASFAAQNPTPGNVALLSQSGAFNTALLDIADTKCFGFKYFVSLGNKADIDELDLLEAWLQDDSIKVIGAYMEEFENGREFVNLILKYPPKPIILLHSGSSVEGQRAAASHTGSIAGSSVTIRTALKQAGVIQVSSIEDMFSNLMMFSWSPFPTGGEVVIVTNAGGPGIMTTDMLSKIGLKLATIDESTKIEILAQLPEHASANNPIDVLGDALAVRYQSVLESIEKLNSIDVVILLLTPQLVTQVEETAKLVINFEKQTDKVVIPIFMGDKYVMPGLERLWRNRIPAYQYGEEATDALKSLVDFSTQTLKKTRVPLLTSTKQGKYFEEIQNLVQESSSALPQELVARMASEVGLDLPKENVVNSETDAAEFFTSNENKPVVIKATTKDSAHKTDAKLLYLNIETVDDLKAKYNELQTNLSSITGNSAPDILIQEMASGDEELIIGLNKDMHISKGKEKGFGYVLIVGQGGIHAEVYQDTSSRLSGITETEVMEMIGETKVSKIIDGHRGKPKLAKQAVVNTVLSLQRLSELYPQIVSADINPCLLSETRCIAVDLKIFV